MIFAKESSPHIRRKDSAWMMMVDVLIALLPTLVFAAVVFPEKTLVNLVISASIMLFAEFVFVGLCNRMPNDGEKHTFKEKFEHAYKGHYQKVNIFAPLVTAVIYVLITPPGAAYYMVDVGALIGIVIGKLVFGGLGNNIFNPAAVGMVAAKLSFGQSYGKPVLDTWYYHVPDMNMGGTALGNLDKGFENLYDYSFLDMFLGKMPGTLGEVYKITIIIGLIYLLIRHTIDWRIVVSYLGTFTLMMLIAGGIAQAKMTDIGVKFYDFALFQLLSGGVLFGATFMFTDPVTGPITKPGRVMFGMIGAVITVLIRLFGALPEGVAFSILIANMFVPVLDFPKWSNVKYTWKNMLTMGLIFVIPTIIMILSLIYGGTFN